MSVPPPSPEAPKKGLHPMAWVGIGCGGLLLIAVIVGAIAVRWGMSAYDEMVTELTTHPQKVAAEKVVSLHPELDLVSEDEESGMLTIRNRATGEEITISYEDLAAGKLTVTGEDGSEKPMGSTDLSQLPAWVSPYPGVSDAILSFHFERGGGTVGMLSFSTSDSPEQVVQFYEGTAKSSYTSSSSMNIGEIEHASKSFRDGKRELSVFTQRQAGNPTRVQVTYEETP
ncbi:MAG: hypothetical protein AAGB14_04680 [Verrucomicrobiota bacterium]